MDDRALYLALVAGLGAVALALEPAARVWRRPRRLLAALVPAVAVFFLWDLYAVAQTHWFFNRRFVTGAIVAFGVPAEELAFLVVVPICALVIFESARRILGER